MWFSMVFIAGRDRCSDGQRDKIISACAARCPAQVSDSRSASHIFFNNSRPVGLPGCPAVFLPRPITAAKPDLGGFAIDVKAILMPKEELVQRDETVAARQR